MKNKTNSTLSASNSSQENSKSNLQWYLQDISKHKVLSREKVEELAQKYRTEDDKKAGEELVLGNLRLVIRIATDYKKHWNNNFIDLIQEGNIGLLLAAKKFDPARGIKFSYYATYWIKAYILKFITNNWRLVKICTTQTMRTLFYNLNKEKRKLELSGQEVNSKKLAEVLNVKESEVVEADKRINSSDFSIESPVSACSKMLFIDTFPHKGMSIEKQTEDKQLKERVRSILQQEKQKLEHRENLILDERLMSESPRTLNEIAGQLRLSKERVRQIEVKLLSKIRSLIKREMPDYSYA